MDNPTHYNYSSTSWTRVTYTQEYLHIDTAYHDKLQPQGRVDIPWDHISRINKSKDLTKLTFSPNLLSHASNRILRYKHNRLYLALDFTKLIDDLLDARMVVHIKYGLLYRKSGFKPRGIQWFKDRGEYIPPGDDPLEDWADGQVYGNLMEPVGSTSMNLPKWRRCTK